MSQPTIIPAAPGWYAHAHDYYKELKLWEWVGEGPVIAWQIEQKREENQYGQTTKNWENTTAIIYIDIETGHPDTARAATVWQSKEEAEANCSYCRMIEKQNTEEENAKETANAAS